MLEDRLALSGTGLGASDNDFAVDGSRGEKMGFAPLEDRSLDPLDSSNDPDWDFLAARMDEVFNLQSKPDSKFTIYIDYDGHVTENAQWNNGYGIETIVHPPYDVDGNDSFFSATELSRMENGWKRTAEDFAAFDVNVTTIDPGVEALVKSSDSDPEWGIRVVATRDSFADCGCG